MTDDRPHSEGEGSSEGAPAAESAAPRRRSGLRSAWEWAKSIGLAIALFLTIRAFLVEAFRIPSGSMEGTLLVGDFLIVNKLLYGAEVPLINERLPDRKSVV